MQSLTMKYFKYYLTCVGLCLIYQTSFSQSSKFHVGIIFNNPTGISAIYFFSDTTAVDAAFSISDQVTTPTTSLTKSYIFHSTYLTLIRNVFSLETGELIYYYGVGGSVLGDVNVNLSIRSVLGLSYYFPKIPFDFFAETSPIFGIYPASTMDFGFGFGFRYHF